MIALISLLVDNCGDIVVVVNLWPNTNKETTHVLLCTYCLQLRVVIRYTDYQ